MMTKGQAVHIYQTTGMSLTNKARFSYSGHGMDGKNAMGDIIRYL